MSFTTKKSTSIFIDLLTIVIGTILSATAFNTLIIPSGLLSGGLTGISQFINHFSPINVGVFYFILNTPLMVLAYKYLGMKFSLYTILSITLISSFLFIIPIESLWTDNILLSAIFGGMLNGVGCGIVLRRGGSQGGLDIVSRIVAKHSNISVGKSSLTINVAIVLVSAFIFNSEIAMYTIISIFVSMKTYEIILNHINRVSVLIVTDRAEEVNQEINTALHRGTTMWNANGGYTRDEKTVLLCVIVEGELSKLKKIVSITDSHSFVSVISTQNVIGRFNQVW